MEAGARSDPGAAGHRLSGSAVNAVVSECNEESNNVATT